MALCQWGVATPVDNVNTGLKNAGHSGISRNESLNWHKSWTPLGGITWGQSVVSVLISLHCFFFVQLYVICLLFICIWQHYIFICPQRCAYFIILVPSLFWEELNIDSLTIFSLCYRLLNQIKSNTNYVTSLYPSVPLTRRRTLPVAVNC